MISLSKSILSIDITGLEDTSATALETGNKLLFKLDTILSNDFGSSTKPLSTSKEPLSKLISMKTESNQDFLSKMHKIKSGGDVPKQENTTVDLLDLNISKSEINANVLNKESDNFLDLSAPPDNTQKLQNTTDLTSDDFDLLL